MEFTNGMIEKARQAASAEELRTMAKEEGFSLTEEEAGQFFAFLHTSGAMSDEELEAVSGGKGGGSSQPPQKFKNGQHVWVGFVSTRNYMHVVVRSADLYDDEKGWRYSVEHQDDPLKGYIVHMWLECEGYVHTTDPGHTWIG